jgi:alkylation response protein AidB-like acyl-CoA dehydrogenase
MRLQPTQEETAFRAQLRTFFRTEIPAAIREKVRAGIEPSHDDIVTTHKILHKHGLAVPNWPVQWGGKDWTPAQYHIWRDELDLACVPEPYIHNANNVGPVIAEFGSPALKQRFLAPTAALDIWWCQGFSEPEAGSDLASLRTTAVRDGDHFVVNGQKAWCSLAQHADWIYCLVRTDPHVKQQAGISLLLFELDSAGVTVRPTKLIDGTDEVNEVFLDDVRVPAEQLVGRENQGWTYAKFLLGSERTGITGVARTKVRLEVAKEHARKTRRLDDPLLAARFAEVENELLALELTLLRLVADSHDGAPNPASSVLKIRGSQLQQAATELLVDIAGPDALPVGPNWAGRAALTYLNYRKLSVYGGSNEVQRNIIAKTILGL